MRTPPGALDAAEWDRFLDQHPEVLNRLLADIYQAARGVSQPPTLDDLWDVLKVKNFSAEPFGAAVHAALNGRSLGSLAAQTGIPKPTLCQWVQGVRPIITYADLSGSMWKLETVAKGLHVHPSYFREWRWLWIVSVLERTFMERSDVSVAVFKRFSGLVDQ